MGTTLDEQAYSERYVRALERAATWHQAHFRKGGRVPYVGHLLAVSALVWEDGGNEDEAIAALLHDSIEDQGKTQTQIGGEFGERVGAVVEACTDSADEDPAERLTDDRADETDRQKEPWKPRKVRHIKELRERYVSPSLDRGVLRVTAADKLANLRATIEDLGAGGDSVWQRFKGGAFGTEWYYSQMIAVVRDGLGEQSKLVRALEFDLKRLSTFVSVIRDRVSERAEPLRRALTEHDPLDLGTSTGPLAALQPSEEYELIAYELTRRVENVARDEDRREKLLELARDWYAQPVPPPNGRAEALHQYEGDYRPLMIAAFDAL